MNKSTNLATNEIWSLIKETQQNIQETQQNIRETQQNIKELSSSQKETDKQIKTLFSSQKETDKQMRKTDLQIQKIGGRFNQRWGAFVESLVEGNLVKLFQERGIDITQSYMRLRAQWKKPDNKIQRREFDIVVANGTEVVVVEVKTSLVPKDVTNFLENLRDFKHYCPKYKSLRIYGAMAYLQSENKADAVAEQEGLFIIRATGDSANIVNPKDFKPKVFS